MTGWSKQAQKAIFDNATVGINRPLYLHWFKSTLGAGDEPNEDGTLPGTLSEVSGGGYAPVLVHANDWTTAAGPPSTATAPNGTGSGGSSLGVTASGANFGNITAWGLSPDSGAWVPANCVQSGPIVDGSGNPIIVPINDGSRIEFTPTNPLILREGNPAKVTDATPGTQRTVPT